MLKTSLTRGLLLALVLVWIGACSSSGVPTSQRAVKPSVPLGVPTENICGWPNYCHPDSAQAMLGQITQLFQADGSIDVELRERLDTAILRCLSPDLRNAENRHVCDLQEPLPCDELRGILEHAEDPEYGVHPKEVDAVLPGHWGTIATELENFPTGK